MNSKGVTDVMVSMSSKFERLDSGLVMDDVTVVLIGQTVHS